MWGGHKEQCWGLGLEFRTLWSLQEHGWGDSSNAASPQLEDAVPFLLPSIFFLFPQSFFHYPFMSLPLCASLFSSYPFLPFPLPEHIPSQAVPGVSRTRFSCSHHLAPPLYFSYKYRLCNYQRIISKHTD